MKDLWPTVVFTPGCEYFIRRHNQELQLYRIPDQQSISVLDDPKVTHFSIGPAAPTKLAIYTKEQSGESASLSLFSLQGSTFQRLFSTPVLKVQDTTFHWNKLATKVIA